MELAPVARSPTPTPERGLFQFCRPHFGKRQQLVRLEAIRFVEFDGNHIGNGQQAMKALQGIVGDYFSVIDDDALLSQPRPGDRFDTTLYTSPGRQAVAPPDKPLFFSVVEEVTAVRNEFRRSSKERLTRKATLVTLRERFASPLKSKLRISC